MDTSIYVCLLVVVVIIWLESYMRQQRKSRARRLPPGPIVWPIIGNFYHLAGKAPHRNVAKLSAKYGPIFTLKMGSRPAVVVSSAKWAKEFLQTHDREFADRPDSVVNQALGSLAFMKTGEYWRQMRKIATLELLSPKKIEACRGLRIQEVRKAMAEISSKNQEPVGIHQAAALIMGGLMSDLIFSPSLSKQSMQMKKMVDVVNNSAAGLIVSDFLPHLGFLDSRAKQRLARFVAARNSLLQEMFKLRRSQYQKLHPQCVLDIFLDLQQQDSDLVHNRDQALYGFFMGLFVAGIDSTASTVEWAMAELIRHPEMLRKVRDEMDREVVRSEGIIDDHRVLGDKEVGSLRYLHAFLNETLRLHPPVPFLVIRESLEDCVVGEGQYELPKGTLVYINVWEIGRDPNVWENPEDFNPERFYVDEHKEDGFRQQQKEHLLLAFGAGRRGCPGKSLGFGTAKIVLANLLYAFEWKMRNDSPPLVDMAEKLMLVSLKKKIPLVAIPTPRHVAPSSNQN